MNKFLSSKLFVAIIAFVVGIVVGWFLWYLVYPNLHTSGSQVWTGNLNPSNSKVSSNTNTKKSTKPKSSTNSSSNYSSSTNSSSSSSNSYSY